MSITTHGQSMVDIGYVGDDQHTQQDASGEQQPQVGLPQQQPNPQQALNWEAGNPAGQQDNPAGTYTRDASLNQSQTAEPKPMSTVQQMQTAIWTPGGKGEPQDQNFVAEHQERIWGKPENTDVSAYHTDAASTQRDIGKLQPTLDPYNHTAPATVDEALLAKSFSPTQNTVDALDTLSRMAAKEDAPVAAGKVLPVADFSEILSGMSGITIAEANPADLGRMHPTAVFGDAGRNMNDFMQNLATQRQQEASSLNLPPLGGSNG